MEDWGKQQKTATATAILLSWPDLPVIENVIPVNI